MSRPATRDPAWQATALAGAGLLAGLALAVARAPTSAAITAALAGMVTVGWLLLPRAWGGVKRHPALLIFLAPLAFVAGSLLLRVASLGSSPVAFGAPWVLVRTSFVQVVVMTVAAACGVVLIADALRLRLAAQRAPWDDLTGTDAEPGLPPWRAVVGVLLVGWAVVLGVNLLSPYLSGPTGAVLLMLLALGGATVIATPLVIAALARRDQAQTEDAWEHERRRFAAHLHDSVLQTLALVQRQAHDPVAVARLARRQEHALRAWMAGHSDLLSETLAGALRDAVAEVEDEAGVTVEVSIIGDRALDDGAQALVGAAREALRNAARHGAGAPIFVFAQITPAGAEVFVRDEGRGFDPATVPAERRGLRDAVIGRMAAVGGSATVESVAGEGTEVALRLGGRR